MATFDITAAALKIAELLEKQVVRAPINKVAVKNNELLDDFPWISKLTPKQRYDLALEASRLIDQRGNGISYGHMLAYYTFEQCFRFTVRPCVM